LAADKAGTDLKSVPKVGNENLSQRQRL